MVQVSSAEWDARALKALAIHERFYALPEFLQAVLQAAQSQLPLERAWIFGSRARSDHRSRSDYDLAFEMGQVDPLAWSRFLNDTSEKKATLLPLQILDLRHARPELRESVSKEGILIYEKI